MRLYFLATRALQNVGIKSAGTTRRILKRVDQLLGGLGEVLGETFPLPLSAELTDWNEGRRTAYEGLLFRERYLPRV
jgi:hypothetical protein